MNRKDEMLEAILNNVDLLMNAESYDVIPYTNLSYSVFNTIKSKIVWDIEYSDIVCVISTSCFSAGKSGIVFTTEHVYTRAWNPLGIENTYKNTYSDAFFDMSRVVFSDFINDFSESRMKNLMYNLCIIEYREDENERKKRKLEELGDIGKVAAVLLVGGMGTLEIISYISTLVVGSNNDEIVDRIARILTEDC